MVFRALLAGAALALIGGAASMAATPLALGGAAAGAAEAAAEGPRKGPVTGLDLPRFVSLKATRANVRRGPGLTHRVDWVFLRRGMPLEVIAEFGHWRRVRDIDDATGWVHYSLLRGDRTAIVVEPMATLRRAPGPDAPPVAHVERGVIVAVSECGEALCQVSADGHKGWVGKAALWGVRAYEVFD